MLTLDETGRSMSLAGNWIQWEQPARPTSVQREPQIQSQSDDGNKSPCTCKMLNSSTLHGNQYFTGAVILSRDVWT
jgi:hypothetical protein